MDWDSYFIKIAETVALKSKDPSTQVGAVVVGPDKRIRSTGYNGFPSGIRETKERWERPEKYEWVVHAEDNAIYSAASAGVALRGCTLYVTHYPCHDCAKGIRQAGIIKVCFPIQDPVFWGRMEESYDKSTAILEEAGISVSLIV